MVTVLLGNSTTSLTKLVIQSVKSITPTILIIILVLALLSILFSTQLPEIVQVFLVLQVKAGILTSFYVLPCIYLVKNGNSLILLFRPARMYALSIIHTILIIILASASLMLLSSILSTELVSYLTALTAPNGILS